MKKFMEFHRNHLIRNVNMNLDDKISNALDVVRQIMNNSKNPVIMSSFGKDSMVVLDLIKRCDYKFPILFFKEPFFPTKYKFANEVILNNGYTVYDYPPLYTGIVKKDKVMEIANFHQIGDETIYLPTGIKSPVNDIYLCALWDIYEKPTGTFKFPWDLVVLGHKSSDKDPILGGVPLNTQFLLGKISAAFPISEFTDEDIWEYIRRFNVPYNDLRYNKDDNFREFADITYNPDYFPACTLCMDKDSSDVVHCPKLDTDIKNVSKSLNYLDIKLPSYIGES